ncbi:MAG TPA: caspase family protein, partial [Polyangia bacterium]
MMPVRLTRASCLLGLGLALLSLALFPFEAAAVEAAKASPQRIAIVVGANAAPPGRRPLQFAHDDARQVADVLRRVGRFRGEDVHLLLDPTPKQLASKLDLVARAVRATGHDAVFVFYYSGHSDGQDLFPHGQTLALSDLRTRIEALGARLRLGILDTCRGGAWTQSKGLSVGAPLEGVDLMSLASEGTALISSSSGLENAHEGRAVRGSFFTHHLTGGLLGAADRNADGSVTLNEAFEYAKTLTIRDSARMAETTQHPSFDLQIRGRGDVVLTRIPSETSTLVVTADEGPLEVIHLASGITVLEMAGRKVNLALAPGRYLVRKRRNGETATKEVDVVAGRTALLSENELEAVASPHLAVLSKGESELRPPLSLRTTLPRRLWDLRYAVGSSTGPHETWRDAFFLNPSDADRDRRLTRSLTNMFSLTYGITDRLTWLA